MVNPWGELCGIRPVKRVRKYMEEGRSDSEITDILKNEFKVSDEKISMSLNIAKTEMKILSGMSPCSVSLYIGIPFCPTRCAYCSFVSMGVEKTKKYIGPYLDALYKEIDSLKFIVKRLKLSIETVYIGGGTPTTLMAIELDNLLEKLYDSFDLKGIKEFTVEAGRPDTITEQKLLVLKRYGVTRISINPQSMNEKTLAAIGRHHTTEQIRQAFKTARECGFSNINMDTIAGLPGETYEEYCYTIDELIKMNPENITVHTLAIKRAADLNRNGAYADRTDEQTVSDMVGYAHKRLRENGYYPYYLYRQKNMLGNQENAGFCKKGTEGLYNIFIMEEMQTILSLGVGGVTKLVMGDRIERIFNVKDVLEYINRIDELIGRKKQIEEEIGI